ncbi:MAG TPA: cytochrome c oxidase subunit II [Acidimicrobiales bacterium]
MADPVTRARPTLRRLALAAMALAVLAGCAKNAPQDTLEPKGPVARQIDNLQNPVFAVAGVVFVLVMGLALYVVIKFRHRDDAPEPVQVHGNTKLELTWTLIPAFTLLVIAVPTIATIFDLAERQPNSLNVTVIGHQFWWEYRYDDFGVVTANELVIPARQPVEITLDGAEDDVIHSFWIPPLGGKQDIVPGHTHRMRIEADEPGTYLGQCTEYCGLSHANMRARAVAVTPAEFETWIRDQQRPGLPGPTGTSEAAQGLALFTSKGCAGCHTVQGISQGSVGPNLTHLYSRETFAGSMFELNTANLRRWLKDPPAEKPGSKMPNLGLTDDEIAQLIAYMETLR